MSCRERPPSFPPIPWLPRICLVDSAVVRCGRNYQTKEKNDVTLFVRSCQACVYDPSDERVAAAPRMAHLKTDHLQITYTSPTDHLQIIYRSFPLDLDLSRQMDDLFPILYILE